MEVNKLHQELKQLYKGADTKYSLYFEFEIKNEIQKKIAMFKKGYWSIMPIGFNNNDIFCIKLTPNDFIKSMPLVKYDDIVKVCNTIAPNLKGLFPICSLNYIDDEEIFVETKNDIDNILKQAIPFQKHVKGENELGFYKDYLLNEKNQLLFKHVDNISSELYVDFWNYYNNSPEQDKTITLLKELLDNGLYLPTYKEVDYGIWNTYVYNILAGRAYSKSKIETKDKWEFYWQSVQQPHGFDAMGMVLSGIEPSLKSTNSTLFGITDSFNSSWEEEYNGFPKEIREHPVFHATESIRIKGDAYIGEAHLLAAAVLDEEYNDPIGAWNALISAGYWAGLKESSAVETVWEAGIHLSEKHNWTEIHEVLVQQYEFYNHYKDKV